MADGISVSTSPLKSVVEATVPETVGKVFLCQNHLHEVAWGPQVIDQRPKFPNKKLIIGWQGSTSHDVDFKEALPALTRLFQERDDVRLRLFGDVPRSIRGVIPENKFEWTGGVPFNRYPEMLSFINFDIGIAPVSSSQFNASKSNLKWLEYAACKVPCVASDISAYNSSIKHGSTGFLASNPDEWYYFLSRLLDDEVLRREVGLRVYEEVWKDWCSTTHADSWKLMFEHLCQHVDLSPTPMDSPSQPLS
jgi:glycosyltransferase involved in cell wall biosynthesis